MGRVGCFNPRALCTTCCSCVPDRVQQPLEHCERPSLCVVCRPVACSVLQHRLSAVAFSALQPSLPAACIACLPHATFRSPVVCTALHPSRLLCSPVSSPRATRPSLSRFVHWCRALCQPILRSPSTCQSAVLPRGTGLKCRCAYRNALLHSATEP